MQTNAALRTGISAEEDIYADVVDKSLHCKNIQ